MEKKIVEMKLILVSWIFTLNYNRWKVNELKFVNKMKVSNEYSNFNIDSEIFDKDIYHLSNDTHRIKTKTIS